MYLYLADDLVEAWHGGWEVWIPQRRDALCPIRQNWQPVETVTVTDHGWYMNFVGPGGSWLAAGVGRAEPVPAELRLDGSRPAWSFPPRPTTVVSEFLGET